jgi:hypothetical protein
VWKWLLLVFTAFCAASCGNPVLRTHAPTNVSAPAPPRAMPLYRIDPSSSEVRVLVYRAGVMAALGHNHVIVNRSIDGWVALADAIPAGSFFLRLPVAGFTVDDDVARAEEGADFAAPVADDAKLGTRRNMLSAAVLDGAHFPYVEFRSLAIEAHGAPAGAAAAGAAAAGAAAAGAAAGPDEWTAIAAVVVAGHETRVVMPFKLDRRNGRLTASGSANLRQSDLGLTPFSIGLGALQVRDELRVRFCVVAVVP